MSETATMGGTATRWADGYALLADLWCSPRDIDPADVGRRAAELMPELERADPEAAASVAQFLGARVSEEEYVELFELDPKCPLYLGSHSFDEPKTCAQAAVSDRNGYMIELLGIYRHLGLAPNGSELPDYLPAVVEFLALTAGSDDPVREKLIREYILPFLPPIRSRLEELQSPYGHLLDAMERVLRLDAGVETTGGRRA
jgi:nitrate reductase delta subunit